MRVGDGHLRCADPLDGGVEVVEGVLGDPGGDLRGEAAGPPGVVDHDEAAPSHAGRRFRIRASDPTPPSIRGRMALGSPQLVDLRPDDAPGGPPHRRDPPGRSAVCAGVGRRRRRAARAGGGTPPGGRALAARRGGGPRRRADGRRPRRDRRAARPAVQRVVGVGGGCGGGDGAPERRAEASGHASSSQLLPPPPGQALDVDARVPAGALIGRRVRGTTRTGQAARWMSASTGEV